MTNNTSVAALLRNAEQIFCGYENSKFGKGLRMGLQIGIFVADFVESGGATLAAGTEDEEVAKE